MFGNYRSDGGQATARLQITDGATTTTVATYEASVANIVNQFDFTIKLAAGHSFQVFAGADARVLLATRQVADIQGNLTDPS